MYCTPHGRIRRACEVCNLTGREAGERANDRGPATTWLADPEPGGVVDDRPTAAASSPRRRAKTTPG